ncbi:MAG TPA: SMI1/KNR4 family protein [Candidatus Eremiobacteraceae bacterium]|jgi:hypothetical protein|nr:SMI1/KNR4 family protein [Candidatus Eremiobacteraceae bacterium]
MITAGFLAEFKRATEAKSKNKSIDPAISGFQIRPEARWNPGLSEELIAEYQAVLNVRFPNDFKALLREMNGTDLSRLNVYASTGHSHLEWVGVYSYPRDLKIVKDMIELIRSSRGDIARDLAEQGFELRAEANLVPIYEHRYVVCVPNADSSVVLSIVVHDTDAIVYGASLAEYLEREFL